MDPSVFPQGQDSIDRICRILPHAFASTGNTRLSNLQSIYPDLLTGALLVDPKEYRSEALFLNNMSAFVCCFSNHWGNTAEYLQKSFVIDPGSYLANYISVFMAFHDWEKARDAVDELGYNRQESAIAAKSRDLYRKAISRSIAAARTLQNFQQNYWSFLGKVQKSLDLYLISSTAIIIRDNMIRHQRTCDILLNSPWIYSYDFTAHRSSIDNLIKTQEDYLTQIG